MCENEKSVHDWLDGLMRKATSALKLNFEDVRYEVSVPDDSFFFSSTYYVSIVEKGAEGRTINVVIKRSPQSQFVRELLVWDVQFHNEIVFYESYAQDSEDFPRCVCFVGTDTGKPAIVLENVKLRGYEICAWKYDPPLEYTLAAMREIGRFHGRGYVMKEKQNAKFLSVVNHLQDPRYGNGGNKFLGIMMDTTASRSVEYLRERGYDRDFCDKMKGHLDGAFKNVMPRAVEPVEPLATLCHGDFTLGNTLFKKDAEGIRAMLIDFALIRYGSPGLDLSTFLCLHCPSNLKKESFRNVFNAYHDALKGYLVEHGLWDQSKYSYDCLYEDFKEHELFGFIIASFFLSTVLGKDTVPLETVMEIGEEPYALLYRKAGGDEVSKILADMLLDLRDLGCLGHIV